MTVFPCTKIMFAWLGDNLSEPLCDLFVPNARLPTLVRLDWKRLTDGFGGNRFLDFLTRGSKLANITGWYFWFYFRVRRSKFCFVRSMASLIAVQLSVSHKILYVQRYTDRYNEGPRYWQNMFAITRFRLVLFNIFYYYWEQENRSLYRSRTSLSRGSRFHYA